MTALTEMSPSALPSYTLCTVYLCKVVISKKSRGFFAQQLITTGDTKGGICVVHVTQMCNS